MTTDVTFATIYPTTPLSAGSTAAVARLVSQTTNWLARMYPGQVAAICLPGSRLENVTQYDLSLTLGQKMLNGIRSRCLSRVGLSQVMMDEGALLTRQGVRKIVEAGLKPQVILTATAHAAIMCRQSFPEARIILWAHAAPERAHEPFAKRAFRAADALVLPSQALYDLLWGRFSFEEFTPPVWIIRNYTDCRQFSAPTWGQRMEARATLGLREDEFAIAHLSRGPVKGLQILEAALPLVDANGRRIVLLSAGDKTRGNRQLGVHVLRRMGRIPVDELRTMYHAADLGVVPSVWFETFGLAALEMMACGLCVVASRSGGLTELIIDGENGRIVSRPNDVELWASTLRDIVHDDVTRQRLADEGRANSIACFNEAAFYDHWTRLINTLMPSRAPEIIQGPVSVDPVTNLARSVFRASS